MTALETLRSRQFRRARLARAWALAAAITFAVLPVLHAPVMAAAPPGFIAVCTADGVAFIPADPALPPPADTAPDAAKAGACNACCPAQSAAPPPATLALAAPLPAAEAAIDPPPEAPALRPTQRTVSRGPPAA